MSSYRDSFRLLLRFAAEHFGRTPSELSVEELDVSFLGEFLEHIEIQRGNCTRARNNRLSALRAFFRYVSFSEPALSLHCQRVLAIPAKRYDRRPVEFLTQKEASALIATPDSRTWIGRQTAAEKDQKRLLRAAIAEVILSKEDRDVTLKIVWAGGAVTEKIVHLPKVRSKRATPLDLVELVRQLAAKFTDDQIARILMRQGRKTPTGLHYNAQKVATIRHGYGIPRYKKPKDEQSKSYTAEQASKILQVSVSTICNWLNSGFIKGTQVSEGAPWEIQLTDEEVKRLTAQDAPQGWLPLPDAAKDLGVSRQTVLNWVKSGKLPYVYVSKGNKKGLRINVNSGACRK